ncbi:MAG: DMT family transporter [Gemmatimonadaceae bacterium]
MDSGLDRTLVLPPTPTQSAAAGTQRFVLSGTDFLLVMSSLIWGINISVVKYGTTLVQPLAYNGVRVTLAAVALLLIAFSSREADLTRRDVVTLLGLGVLGNGLYQLFFIQGVASTRAGNAALVLAATPAFVALIGRIVGVERIGHRGVAGIALSIVGIALVAFSSAGGDGSQSGTLAGDLMILAGTLCWSLFSVLLKPLAGRVGTLRVAALTMTGGAIPLLLFSLPAILATNWLAVPLVGWGAIVFSGLGALVVAYLFWYRGVRLLGPTRTAMYGNLQPVIALAFAWLALSEVPTIWQVLGATTIIAGIVLTRR